MTEDAPDIEVFILDLFGVIVSFDNDIMYSRLARHCADPTDAFVRLNGLMSGQDVITGKVTLPDIHRQLVNMHGLTLGYVDFKAAWLEPYSEPMPGMADLIKALSKHYRLVMLSNVDRYYWEVVLAMHPELQHFESLLLSCDLGLAKPDPEIFLFVCQMAKVPPSRCFFVDDTQVNIDAAKALGLQAHHFQGIGQLRQTLTEANVEGVGSTDRV